MVIHACKIRAELISVSLGFNTTTFFGSETYMVSMPEEFITTTTRYAKKLGKALYYFHTGRILRPDGFVHVASFTNCEFASPNFPLDRFRMLTVKPLMTRAGKDLSDQFAYRCAITEDEGGAAFLIQFRQGLAMAIVVYQDKAAYLERKKARELLTSKVGEPVEAGI